MRLALIADVYPPLRSSGAVQLRDLSIEFARQGHDVTMMVASPELTESWKIETWNGVQVVRLKTWRTKDTNYLRRSIGEFLMPFLMARQLRKSPLASQKWDGVIWYSPTIFLGPIVSSLKTASKCKSYLILRDIFPEWAVDMGLIGRGLPYRFFKAVANYQYSVADVIGVQSPGNQIYLADRLKRSKGRVEVLQNWLADTPNRACSISVAETSLAGRKILVYAGNIGVAQGMDIMLGLADQLRERLDVGFLFVGRGSEAERLRIEAEARGLSNVVFFDEIDPDEIPGVYAQCHIGLVSLDPRHRTHNIPGKFLSYMQSGLPVLASVNPKNDIVALIQTVRVGQVCSDASVQTLKVQAEKLLDDLDRDRNYAGRCRDLFANLYSPEVTVKKIAEALKS